jgi:RNA polymerase sigma-70 factor (ECF subfamily)
VVLERPVPFDATADRERSFRRLLDAHLDRTYGLAMVILGDRSDAEDATHDAIEKAWRGFAGLRSVDRFESWFHRILINVCRDRMRARRPLLTLPDDGSLGSRQPLPSRERDLALRTAERDALERALATLGDDQRVCIALRYFMDLEIDEIAARLGARPGTVKSRLHRAIAHLRAAYDAAARIDPEGVR